MGNARGAPAGGTSWGRVGSAAEQAALLRGDRGDRAGERLSWGSQPLLPVCAYSSLVTAARWDTGAAELAGSGAGAVACPGRCVSAKHLQQKV